MRGDAVDQLDRMLEKGLLLFLPTYVRRLYRDGGRLGFSPGSGGTSRPRLWRPERWIASTVRATSSSLRSAEGLSRLALDQTGRASITFRQALQWRGERILGASRFRRYGSDFPLLAKILDPGEPIVFHFHATDRDVRRYPRRFPGQRWGKDEAYYFLPGPRGAVPYTHVGLHPGVTRRTLAEAIARGDVLDLSPVVHQRPGEGFFVPAGIPHRPGTALTLEIQQPSDVYTLLEHRWGDRLLCPAQMHPGFASIEEALTLIDYAAATHPGLLDRHRLVTEPVAETRARGGEEFWIFPPRLRKFSGKRLVVRSRFESQEAGPYVLLVWRGRGRLLGHRLRPGTEALVTAECAARPHLFTADQEPLEVFKLFPP
ncbi:MAG: hypothetical protein QN175_09840 [Armatimonadota bacterium]|nr:hypothetical protein [Armatimonadota bacterium]